MAFDPFDAGDDLVDAPVESSGSGSGLDERQLGFRLRLQGNCGCDGHRIEPYPSVGSVKLGDAAVTHCQRDADVTTVPL